jgi:hypothetical protein
MLHHRSAKAIRQIAEASRQPYAEQARSSWKNIFMENARDAGTVKGLLLVSGERPHGTPTGKKVPDKRVEMQVKSLVKAFPYG